jgi:hypothetical protein
MIGRTWRRPSGGARPFTSAAGPMTLSRGGTETLSLQPDGRFVMRAAGPDDRPRDIVGSWRAVDDGAELQSDDGSLRAVARLTAEDQLFVTPVEPKK